MKNIFFCIIVFPFLFCLSSCNSSDTGKTTQTENKATAEVKSVFINGDSIHYIDVGKGDPVVFIHGAVGDYRTFSAQMDEFAKKHRVISYSRRFAYPNKQLIADSTQLTVASHSRDLAEFLKAMNLGKADLVGHSYGADIALLVAINHPELVNRLVLAEPFIPSLMQSVQGGDTLINNFIGKAFMPAIEEAKNNNDEKVTETLISGVTGDSLYFSRLPQNERENMITNVHEIKGVLFIKDAFPAVACDDVKKITAPVLLVKGDKSPVIFSLMVNELKRCLSKADIATLANTTHGLEYESPDKFNKAVLEFMDK